MRRKQWWKEDAEGDGLVKIVEWAEEAASIRYWKDIVHESIYDNQMYAGSDYSASLELLRTQGFSAARLNATHSIVQTIVSKLGIKRPAVKMNASDVRWSYKNQARQLTRVIRGASETTKMARLSPQVIKDACIVGTGITFVGPDDGKVVVERVPREELFVDPRESRYGSPRSLFRRRIISRDVLADRYPDYAEVIMGEIPAARDWPGDTHYEDVDNYDESMVDFYEGWHLPSGKDADDGVYMCAIRGQVLANVPWKRQRFPFSFMRYDKPRKGFWGRGVVEDVADMQWKVDEIVRDLQQALYFGAQLRIWVPEGAPVADSALGRMSRPSIFRYLGNKPLYDTPEPLSKDALGFLEQMIQWMYDFTGVSMMAAQAKNPIGAGASAVALQEFYDIQSERYSQLESMVADWWVDTSGLILDAYKDLSEADDEYEVEWVDRDVVHKVKWADYTKEGAEFRLTLEPSNFLPDTRAGKLEGIERLAKAGIVVGPEASALMAGFPDLERANRLRNAGYEIAEKMMEQLADLDQDPPIPDSHLDLPLTHRMAQAELNIARCDDAPEEVVQRYLNFLSLITDLINKGKQAAPPEPTPEEMMAAQMGAGAPPGQPPVPGAPPAPMGPPPGVPMTP
jgi:hypothetical protein